MFRMVRFMIYSSFAFALLVRLLLLVFLVILQSALDGLSDTV